MGRFSYVRSLYHSVINAVTIKIPELCGAISIENTVLETKTKFPKFKVPAASEDINNKAADAVEDADNLPWIQISDIPKCPVRISR